MSKPRLPSDICYLYINQPISLFIFQSVNILAMCFVMEKHLKTQAILVLTVYANRVRYNVIIPSAHQSAVNTQSQEIAVMSVMVNTYVFIKYNFTLRCQIKYHCLTDCQWSFSLTLFNMCFCDRKLLSYLHSFEMFCSRELTRLVITQNK